ncbi:MAG TPA: tetratricopeptide repeat protein [Pseudolabrys sp.]|jgi:TPR repeat protein|nr:tetratricopeptide repeat protein [Pseudolabrys sp.]
MRTPDVLLRVAVIGIGLSVGPALAFDGTRSSSSDTLTPMQAFRAGAQALRSGETEKGLTALEYAAEKGHALAQWKLGRMYAEGDGVPQDDLRAFEYFRSIADSHAEDNPATPRARFVANAFVALGNYYLEGIPNTKITADPERARQMFAYAASYFGDPDAQYHLARLYLEGLGVPRDPRQAARWLLLAAHKGQYQAQATLGAMLFSGDKVPRQAALGLMWLTLAKDSAKPDQTWINKLYTSAFKQATDDERAMALVYLERLLKNRRE